MTVSTDKFDADPDGERDRSREVNSLCNLAQQLLSQVGSLQQAMNQDAAEISPPASVQAQIVRLQRDFQRIVSDLDDADIDPAIEQRLRPCQTEAHRWLRLLGVNAMRLRTAKQPERIDQERSQLAHQLTQLHPFYPGYCQ